MLISKLLNNSGRNLPSNTPHRTAKQHVLADEAPTNTQRVLASTQKHSCGDAQLKSGVDTGLKQRNAAVQQYKGQQAVQLDLVVKLAAISGRFEITKSALLTSLPWRQGPYSHTTCTACIQAHVSTGLCAEYQQASSN
jgi:hypothetical protein